MGIAITKRKSKAVVLRAITHRKPRRAVSGKLAGTGVVKFLVQGSQTAASALNYSPAKLVGLLQAGLPFNELQVLQNTLDVQTDRLASMLGISKATLHRRKGQSGTLPPAVSDRIVRYARLLGRAVKVFGILEDAKLWLNSPQFGLGGGVPLEYAKTEVGAREVENLLGRIEYGVYT